MEANNNLCFFTCLLLFLKSSSLVQSSNSNSSSSSTLTQSLDVLLHDHAFKALNHRRPRTGALYDATLPASLAGMKLSVVRLRSRTLWRKGANFSHFHIPPNTLPVPYVHRLIIVYHDLGNWSSVYFNISGYSMMTSVVGFMAYDSDSIFRNLSRLEFNTTGEPISIQFKDLNAGIQKRTKCAIFNVRGEVSLSSTNALNICYTRGPGHFSIVIPYKKRRRIKEWSFWMIGFGLGIVGLAMAGLVAKFCIEILRGKRMWEMEKEADEGESIDTIWIDESRMPRATTTRTYPVLENPTF